MTAKQQELWSILLKTLACDVQEGVHNAAGIENNVYKFNHYFTGELVTFQVVYGGKTANSLPKVHPDLTREWVVGNGPFKKWVRKQAEDWYLSQLQKLMLRTLRIQIFSTKLN